MSYSYRLFVLLLSIDIKITSSRWRANAFDSDDVVVCLGTDRVRVYSDQQVPEAEGYYASVCVKALQGP